MGKTIQSQEPNEESTISTSSAQEENINVTVQKSDNIVEADISTDNLSEEETKTESNIDNKIQKEETITNVPIHSDAEKQIKPPEEATITEDVPIKSDAERQIEPSKSSENPSENIESKPVEEKLTEEQVKAMVAKVEGKCQNISSDIANMAMSEQYLRTKQAMLMAKKEGARNEDCRENGHPEGGGSKKDERKSPTNAGAPKTEKGKASNNRRIDGRKGRRKEAH